MCVVSMVIDHYNDKWNQPGYPNIQPWFPIDSGAADRERIRILEEEVAELKKLLERARKYDKDNNEPDCEVKEKIESLKRIAKERGIDISGTGI